jgi:hypothetical protein
MIHLPHVDLVAMDGIDGNRLVDAVRSTLRGLQFRRVLVWAPNFPVELHSVTTEYRYFKTDYEGWNRFMVKELWKYVPNGFCLFIHHDGYVLNPRAWRSEFMEFDYIGAPWWYTDGINVGNGGFSFRSKRFLDVSNEFEWDRYHPEDHRLIRENGHIMQAKGIRFAPEIMASKFALEGNWKWGLEWNGQFGFHNINLTDISRSKDYV